MLNGIDIVECLSPMSHQVFKQQRQQKVSHNNKNLHYESSIHVIKTYEQTEIWAVRMSLSWKLTGNYDEKSLT